MSLKFQLCYFTIPGVFLAFVSAGKRFIAIFIYICIPRDITIIAV